MELESEYLPTRYSDVTRYASTIATPKEILEKRPRGSRISESFRIGFRSGSSECHMSFLAKSLTLVTVSTTLLLFGSSNGFTQTSVSEFVTDLGKKVAAKALERNISVSPGEEVGAR